MKTVRQLTLALAAVVFCMAGHSTAVFAAEPPEALVARYAGMLNQLRAELTAKAPKIDLEKAKTPGSPEAQQLRKFLASDALDAKLAKYVVLHEATPKGLAQFAGQGKAQATLIKSLLADDKLMKEMVMADGASTVGRGGPAAYGEAMLIYKRIQKESGKANDGVLRRLALAAGVNQAGGHASAIRNIKANANRKATKEAQEKAKKAGDKKWKHVKAPAVVVPEAAIAEAVEKHYKHVVQHYMQFEKAYLGGELDPAFGTFTVWELTFLFGWGDPDGHLAWGREMLRNLRPDHIYAAPDTVRYSVIVNTCVKYGSGHVVFDRPEQYAGQNIIMNGGVCGRRAGMGRYMCRSFGIPATARPSPRHGALVRWSPNGWWPNLGPGWGSGYVWGSKDLWFRDYTQARESTKFVQVKRAYWIGDVLGEKRTYRTYHKDPPEGWNGAALHRLRAIVEEAKAAKDAPPKKKQRFDDIDEAIGPTLAQKVMAAPITPADREITYGQDGAISIPAAACTPRNATPCVTPMKSFAGGLQIFLPRFSTRGRGRTIVRGGGMGQEAKFCKSGWRMKDGNKNPAQYSYGNWGFRAAMTPQPDQTSRELTLELGDGVKLELVYIKPGKFVMGGENTWDNRFGCVELPKHEVTITKGFYLGKYEVTQGHYQAIMGANPGGATKQPNLPAGGITVGNAWKFCDKVAEKTGRDVRLPTEAEWEYACRAGSTTAWFFGDDSAKLGDYAWYKDNDGRKLHPVGQKKPNPWGLYDICGNVFERVADVYVKDYYANSPKEDPTGPMQGDGSGTSFKYSITVPDAAEYTLSARMVTVNFNQNLHVSVDGGQSEVLMKAPYTGGKWLDTDPVTIALEKGKNTLLFKRSNPDSPQPVDGKDTLHFQRGIAVKSFTLKPVR